MTTQQIEHRPVEDIVLQPHVTAEQITEPATELPRFIACTVFTGEIAYDPPLDYRQGRPFANWARSHLSWQRRIVELPLEDDE